jgi:DNA-binding Xre family transcriptional regulator
LIREWREKETVDRKELDKANLTLLKERDYVDRIERL